MKAKPLTVYVLMFSERGSCSVIDVYRTKRLATDRIKKMLTNKKSVIYDGRSYWVDEYEVAD